MMPDPGHTVPVSAPVQLDSLGINIGPTRDWLTAGLTTAQFRTLVRKGDLVRLRRGVYSTASFAAEAGDDDARRHFVKVSAAIHSQYKGGSAVASHQSAAILQGISLLGRPERGDTVWLTRPPGTYRGNLLTGIRLHSAELPEGHVTRRLGIPVTAPARTVLDLARSLPYTEGVIAADSALHSAIVFKEQLAEMLSFFDGWPGVDKARRVVAFSDRRPDSPLESAARVVFADGGLPAPDLQTEIVDGNGRFVGEVDFCWPGHHTIAEADGAGKYEKPDTGRKQTIRDNRLRDLGYKVVRFTWHDLFDTPDLVVTRVRSAFGAPTPY